MGFCFVGGISEVALGIRGVLCSDCSYYLSRKHCSFYRFQAESLLRSEI